MKLQGKNALVTGASRGIGKAIAVELAKEGCNVAVIDLDIASAQETAEELKAYNVNAIAIEGNVAKLSDAEMMVKETISAFGNLDILINNAGITRDGLVLRMSEDQFDSVIDVNLKGTWNTVKAAARPMLKQKSGRIINMASVVGLIGNFGQSNYVASKAGVIGMTKSLAKEFGAKGVTVNAVAPGFIKTAMTDALSEEIKEQYLTQIPLRTFGDPEDIAKAVIFLASDDAKYITGQTISINGGMV